MKIEITAGDLVVIFDKVEEITPADRAWDRMVEHAGFAARTTGQERTAARIKAREAYLHFRELRDAERPTCGDRTGARPNSLATAKGVT